MCVCVCVCVGTDIGLVAATAVCVYLTTSFVNETYTVDRVHPYKSP